MAKLYFRYGAMGSAKTLNLLAVAHNYQRQGKRVFLIKPRLDTRFGEDAITSRAGLAAPADLCVDESTKLGAFDVDCILVDEAQFLSVSVIDDLRRITIQCDIPVICYGLRTDYRTRLFPGSARLMEVADTIEEIKTTCQHCDRKATCNLRLVDGRAALDGPTVLIGDAQYVSVCWQHWAEAVNAAR